LAEILADIVMKYQNKEDQLSQLFTMHQSRLQSFVAAYRDRTDFKKRPGPFIGCVACEVRCLYRWDVAVLINKDRSLERKLVQSMNNAPNDSAMWKQMNLVSQMASDRLVAGLGEKPRADVSICFLAQMTAKLNLSASNQSKASQSLKTLLTHKDRVNKEGKQ